MPKPTAIARAEDLTKRILFTISLCLCLVGTNVWADQDGSYTNYDSIVNELKSSVDDVPETAHLEQEMNWDEVAIHANIGFATSLISITAPNGQKGSGMLKGFQLGFGMNLFTNEARAEGAFSSFGSEDLDSNLHADLKEFELRVVFLPPASHRSVMRLGAGLAARYMDLSGRGFEGVQSSTPVSVFLIGFERKISKNVAICPDLSYRSALVSDTFDRSAWDAVVRLNATF